MVEVLPFHVGVNVVGRQKPTWVRADAPGDHLVDVEVGPVYRIAGDVGVLLDNAVEVPARTLVAVRFSSSPVLIRFERACFTTLSPWPSVAERGLGPGAVVC